MKFQSSRQNYCAMVTIQKSKHIVYIEKVNKRGLVCLSVPSK